MPKFPQYPEHDKLAAIKDQAEVIGEFLDWLNDERRIVLAFWSDDEMYPVQFLPYLHEYFGIRSQVLDAEKRAMLDELNRLGQS